MKCSVMGGGGFRQPESYFKFISIVVAEGVLLVLLLLPPN